MLIRHHSKNGTSKSEYFEDYAESKLERLERLPFGVKKIDVCTYKEGAFYTVELCILGKKEVRASASTNDLMESLDSAISKAVSQITKLKLTSHHVRRERRKSKRAQKDEVMKSAGFIGEVKKTA